MLLGVKSTLIVPGNVIHVGIYNSSYVGESIGSSSNGLLSPVNYNIPSNDFLYFSLPLSEINGNFSFMNSKWVGLTVYMQLQPSFDSEIYNLTIYDLVVSENPFYFATGSANMINNTGEVYIDNMITIPRFSPTFSYSKIDDFGYGLNVSQVLGVHSSIMTFNQSSVSAINYTNYSYELGNFPTLTNIVYSNFTLSDLRVFAGSYVAAYLNNKSIISTYTDCQCIIIVLETNITPTRSYFLLITIRNLT